MKRWLMLCAALWAPATLSAALPAEVDGQPLPSLAPVLEEVTPSVVNIYTQTRVRVRSPLLNDPFFRRFFNIPDVPRERVSQSLGSGVIVDGEAGYVLTNNHVIAGADDVSITLADGRSFDALSPVRPKDVSGSLYTREATGLTSGVSVRSGLAFSVSKRFRYGDGDLLIGVFSR